MQNALVPYQFGYNFGIGVDSASGDSRQLGIVGAPAQIQGAGGGSGGFQMLKIESMSDMEDHLGISADASGGVGLFSASARFSFARDCKVQTNSIALMLTCTRQIGFTQIDKPALDADAASLVANGQNDLFTQRYGDSFVRGIESGGQFFGIIRIDVKTEEDHKTISGSLSGSYGPFSADVQTNITSALKQTNSSASTFLYYEGGDVQMKPQSPQDLFIAADQWSQSVLAAPKPYSVLLVPWVIANGPLPLNAADLQNQKDVLISCAKLRSQVIDRMNILEYILGAAHRLEFQMQQADVDNLNNLYAGVSSDHDMIQKAASFALDNAKKAIEPVTYARTIGGNPSYTFTALANLPKRVDGANIPVPDFSQPKTWNDLSSLAAQSKLTFHYVMANQQPGYNFVRQEPPVGNPPLAAGDTVTVIGNGQPPRPILMARSPVFLQQRPAVAQFLHR